MGSGASSPAPAPATPFKALSLRISRKDTHKVPLNIAVASVIVVQRYVRGHLARKKYKQMRSREKIMAQAATDYLNSVRMQRVKTDRHSEVGMLRRSWMEGSDSPMRGMGSFSFDSTNHHHHDSAAHSISGTLSTFGGHRDRENSLAAASRRFSYDDHNLLHTQKEVDETDEERALIYPFIGFVIKAKLEISGRKVFINLSHSPKIQRAAAATLRTWTEEKRHDDDGELIVEEVLVIDLVIPSSDFDDRFVYKDGVGLVPTGPHVKDHLGDLCVMMLNSIDHCPDPLTPPISSLKSSEDYKLSPHTNWPKIKRGYVGNIFPMIYEPSDPSLSYCQPFRLSRDLPPVTTQVVAAMCPPEVRAWMSIALSSIGAYDALSNIARVGQGDRKFKKFNELDKGIEGDLEAHQKQYVDQVRRLKEGYRVFVVVHYGLLYIYNSDSTQANGESSTLSLPYPYGKQEMIRYVMSSIDLETSVDLVNDLYFLHLDFITEELETLFVLSKFLNMISSTTLNPRKLTLQFRSFSELQTWKMIFEQHSQYAQYAMARIPILAPTVKFHGVSMSNLPSGKSTWLTEKLGPKSRKRIFAKIDRGWFIIFPNDNSVTPSLANAMDIFSLATVRCEVAHRKIIRLRKWITKITLYDDENERKREFYLRSNEGELDSETKAVLNALGSNITYAHSQFFRYIIPWLDDNDILGDFNAPAPSPAATGGTPAVRTTILNCVGCNVDLQIIIPEPQTSDDDSDIEAERNVDDSISGSVFRVLRPKPHQGGSSERAGSSFSTRSRSIFSPSADNHSRFQVVNEKIQNEYNNFSPSYFPGRILLYQDYNILLILHANRLVGLVNITRCIEKTPIVRKTKRAAAKKSVDASIYTLGSSDDEDDSSDRDYFDDSNPLAAAEDESVRAWMIQLIGYDGRIYRIKFSNITEYDDWRKTVQSRCITPNNPGTASSSSAKIAPPKLAKSESFKGNHSFEFLKEHSISSAESTASSSSLLSGSSSSALATPSSLLTSMLSGAGKILSSRSEDKPWEPVIDSDATKKFSRSLRVSEKVFASGVVLKHEKTVNNANAAIAPKQKRILLVTDTPRMIFIDTIGNIARGNLELSRDQNIEVREVDGTDFEVVVAGNPNRFTPQDTSDKDAKFWVRVLKHVTAKP